MTNGWELVSPLPVLLTRVVDLDSRFWRTRPSSQREGKSDEEECPFTVWDGLLGANSDKITTAARVKCWRLGTWPGHVRSFPSPTRSWPVPMAGRCTGVATWSRDADRLAKCTKACHDFSKTSHGAALTESTTAAKTRRHLLRDPMRRIMRIPVCALDGAGPLCIVTHCGVLYNSYPIVVVDQGPSRLQYILRFGRCEFEGINGIR